MLFDRDERTGHKITKHIVVAAFLGMTIPLIAGERASSQVIVEQRVRQPDGRMLSLKAPEGGATVLVFYSTECPISNAYSTTLNSLLQEFPAKSLKLVGLCVDPDLSDGDIAAHQREFRLEFPVASDRRGIVATKLGVKATPEAVLLDNAGRVRYQGRIDDQFAARRLRNEKPKTHELRDAIAAVLAGRPVALQRVEAVGCPLPEFTRIEARPTYTGEVASILQQHCQECHRPGQVGPFSLMSYEQARKRASDIAAVVDARTMPPWKPVAGIGPKLKHLRALSSNEIATLVAWSESGAPLGDPAISPPPRQFPDEWFLGTPDLVLEPPDNFSIPASGGDIYRCFVIPTDLPNDVYISAIEYRPGNRRVVHHALSYVDTSGEARKRDAADPGLGYSCFSGPGVEVHGDLGGWAPGNEPSRLPDGVGRPLPAKADVVMQIHYHPSGKNETDRTRMGLYFSRKPVQRSLQWAAAANFEMKLPPGEGRVVVPARWKVPVDLEALAVTPHMHLLGKEMSISIILPNGRVEPLVKVNDWDFQWQNTYYFERPVIVPKDSILEVVGVFDNSTANPRNPYQPPKEIRWGEATTDEMCIGFLAVTKAGQDLTRPGAKNDLREIIEKSYDEQYPKKQQPKQPPER